MKFRGKWYMIYGPYWMIQWQFASWLSFGAHIEFGRLYTGRNHIPYGPYIDIHLFNFIFSVGYHPYVSIPGAD